MGQLISTTLAPSAEQHARLTALQQAFAEACNAISGHVQNSRCWNRVALHHMVYREMRTRFPALGSQMICNAVYSVARAYRLLLQHPHSPWFQSRQAGSPLPCLRFMPGAPVYFDRHTLSLRKGSLSLYTLEGRLRFQVDLGEAEVELFQREKLKEVYLLRSGQLFLLRFLLGEDAPAAAQDEEMGMSLPDYLVINDRVPKAPPQEGVLA